MEHKRLEPIDRERSSPSFPTLGDPMLRRLVDRLPDPVFVKDRQHRWVYLNDACCDFIGYSRDELIGHSDYEFFPGDQADVFWARDNHVFDTGECDNNVEDFTDAQGVLHTIATRKSLICLEDGTPVLVGVIHDVTHVRERQKSWETALRAAREQIASLIDSAPVTIATIDRTGRLTMLRGKLPITLHPDLFVGSNAFEIIEPFPKLTHALRLALDGERASVVHEHQDYAFEIQFAPTLNVDGDRTGCIVAIHDITERQRLQRRLAQTDKMESMGRLARGVAHDFNNLLTIIQSALDMVEISARNGIASQGSKSLRTIRDAADRAARLTRQLLSFAKENVVRLEKVDLNAVIEDMKDLLYRMMGKDIDLKLDIDDEALWVHVDPAQIEQVLLNLCINAAEAMPEGGSLRIGTRRSAALFGRGDQPPVDGAEIEVSDDGVGMSDQTLAHIFEPLFTTREDGTGIGLSTCHAIISELGGRIEVESRVGEGSTFRLLLPLVSEDQEAEDLKQVPFGLTIARPTVLLVEDDATLRTTVSSCLEEMGFSVIAAEHGLAAKEVVETGTRVDVVVTDVVMPRMSGPQFVSWLAGRVPSIFVTGYANDVLIRHGLADPDTDFLHKPYTLSQLHRKITDVLARSGQSVTELVRQGLSAL